MLLLIVLVMGVSYLCGSGVSSVPDSKLTSHQMVLWFRGVYFLRHGDDLPRAYNSVRLTPAAISQFSDIPCFSIRAVAGSRSRIRL